MSIWAEKFFVVKHTFLQLTELSTLNCHQPQAHNRIYLWCTSWLLGKRRVTLSCHKVCLCWLWYMTWYHMRTDSDGHYTSLSQLIWCDDGRHPDGLHFIWWKEDHFLARDFQYPVTAATDATAKLCTASHQLRQRLSELLRKTLLDFYGNLNALLL